MAISIGFATSEGGPILPPGQHPCILKTVQVVEQKKYQSEEIEEKIQFSFEQIGKLPPGQDGPGMISTWVGLNYGPKNAKITDLLDAIFGRALTQDEIKGLDIEAMAGVVKGYCLVVPHTKQDGTRTSKFGSFIPAKGQALPSPTDFPLVRTTSPNAQKPLSQSHASRPPASPPDWVETDDLQDPFDN